MAELDKEAIFAEQTELINKINKLVSPEAFDNFVPSYTAMATAYQLFNNDLSPKNRVILGGAVACLGWLKGLWWRSKKYAKIPIRQTCYENLY